MSDQTTVPNGDPNDMNDPWFENDDGSQAGDGDDGRSRRKKYLVGAGILVVLMLAIGTVAGVAMRHGKQKAVQTPSTMSAPTQQAAKEEADEPEGIDLSGCTPEQITIRKDGWIGFSGECVKLISSEDTTDEP